MVPADVVKINRQARIRGSGNRVVKANDLKLSSNLVSVSIPKNKLEKELIKEKQESGEGNGNNVTILQDHFVADGNSSPMHHSHSIDADKKKSKRGKGRPKKYRPPGRRSVPRTNDLVVSSSQQKVGVESSSIDRMRAEKAVYSMYTLDQQRLRLLETLNLFFKRFVDMSVDVDKESESIGKVINEIECLRTQASYIVDGKTEILRAQNDCKKLKLEITDLEKSYAGLDKEVNKLRGESATKQTLQSVYSTLSQQQKTLAQTITNLRSKIQFTSTKIQSLEKRLRS